MTEQLTPTAEQRAPERVPAVYDPPDIPGKGPTDWLGGWKWGIISPLILLGLAFRVEPGSVLFRGTFVLDELAIFSKRLRPCRFWSSPPTATLRWRPVTSWPMP